jgi:nitroimidazol reductase NimA-like FMN-containing flavoprotein (pyridoxamine 5'-phosphate oxidase superfamily)
MKILDASESEFGGPMTEDEVRYFLVNSNKNVHISTLDEKGEPNIHPAWYYFDNNNNKLYIESGRESKKTRNLRRNNIIYYCIDDDNIPYKGVRGKGTVRISDDVDYNLPIIERIVVKYLGNIQHPTSETLISSIRNKEAIIIEITPKFYSTWDYAKAKVKK